MDKTVENAQEQRMLLKKNKYSGGGSIRIALHVGGSWEQSSIVVLSSE